MQHYDPTLGDDVSWVRMLIGDRAIEDTDTPLFQDEEITAVLTEEGNKYLAAARLARQVVARGKGVVSKAVGDLSLSYGSGGASDAYSNHINELLWKGNQQVYGSPLPFRVL